MMILLVFLLSLSTVFTLNCTVCDLKFLPPHDTVCNKTCEGDVCFIALNKYFNGTINAGCMHLGANDSFNDGEICQKDRDVNRCACSKFDNCNNPKGSFTNYTFTKSPILKAYPWFQQSS